MSDKSGITSQVISLPKGGGALHGIGEKFSPDLHTGTGNLSVPIALPPGRNGLLPQLNLVYSTGSGNGPFGLGWSLSVPGLSRKTAKGVPRYDASDVFILSGTEDLIPVSGVPPGSTQYRPRTEGLFARIQRHHDPQNDHWEVRSKDGLVSHYGTPEAAGNDPAVIADPAKRTKVFAWKLTETIDPFGNRIVYEYERDLGDEPPHRWDQLNLTRIRYADYADSQGKDAFLVSLTFFYADRPDPFSEYRPGFEIRTRKRCERIEVWTHADQERHVRTYHLVYLDQRAGLEGLSPLNGVSLLSQVRVVGHDGAASDELPPLEFGYTRFEPECRDFFPIAGADLPPRSLAHVDFELVDLFGHGLPDILEMNGTVRYWRNTGSGRFDLPREMNMAPAGVRLADQGVQLIDASGDGRPDLLVTTNGLAGYYPLQFGGLWNRDSFQRYRFAPSFDLEDPEVRLVDLDGNGVTDAIRSGARFECFFNDPREGWNGTRRVERRALEEFPSVSFSDPRVRWADMTGDGLQDIVLIYDGCVEYWPNLGYGSWARRVTMRDNPRFSQGYDPRRILVGDIDGDALADIVYVDDSRVTLWINQGGDRWSDPIDIAGTPPVTDLDAVRLVDLLGTGVGGILWSADAGGLSRASMFFLDLTGGVKPYLLSEMDNHMGAVTRVGYESSTRFYLADQQRPETRWKTPLPFPVQVVARVAVLDHFSGGKLTTEYRYHHGYWDGAESEFRGFGRVDQRDTEVFEDFHGPGLHGADRPFAAVPPHAFSPPTETRTWFHQGPIGDEFGEWTETDFSDEFWPGDGLVFSRPPSTTDLLKSLPRRDRRDALRALRGSTLRTELYALDSTQRQDRPYTVTENLHSLREEATLGAAEEDRPRIFFPHELATRTTQWERGDDPMTQFTFTADYDEYGQPGSRINVAVPRGRDFRVAAVTSEPYLVTQTLTTRARRDDTQRYLIDRVARTTTFEIKNDGAQSLFAFHEQISGKSIEDLVAEGHPIIGQTLNYYDGPAFEGLPFAALGDFGAPVRSERLVLTPEILLDAYRGGDTDPDTAEAPPYLELDGAPLWTDEYPQEFRKLAPLAGYAFYSGDAEHAPGYFVTTERRRYDVHDPLGGRGLLLETLDPLGHKTVFAYDAFALLPNRIAAPAGLVSEAAYDYRVLQPREVTDPNGP